MMMLSTEKETTLALADGAPGKPGPRDAAMKLPRPRSARPAPNAAPGRDGKDRWPAEVELILSALEAASSRGSGASRQQRAQDERGASRLRHRVRATLRLFSDADGAPPWLLYTRDANPRGLGFITPHRLPLGYGGMIEVAAPSGDTLRVACTLLRCRQVTNGWYEGSLYFNREQDEFVVG